MSPQNVIKLCALTLIVLLDSGCVVRFLHPLSNEADAKFDERLFGRWDDKNRESKITKGQEFEGIWEPSVQFDKGSGQRVNVSMFDSETKERVIIFTAFVTKGKRYNYLNLQLLEEGKPSDGYLIARYAIDGDKLTIWLPDENKIFDLLEQQKLAGGTKGQSPMVTERPERSLAMFESVAGENLFEHFATYARALNK